MRKRANLGSFTEEDTTTLEKKSIINYKNMREGRMNTYKAVDRGKWAGGDTFGCLHESRNGSTDKGNSICEAGDSVE